jgi:hypothetical protein
MNIDRSSRRRSTQDASRIPAMIAFLRKFTPPRVPLDMARIFGQASNKVNTRRRQAAASKILQGAGCTVLRVPLGTFYTRMIQESEPDA